MKDACGAMISWLEPAPALREFVRWYVYIRRTATAEHPVLPVLETRLAFYPRSACRVFDHRLQGIDTMARAAVIGPQTRHWVDLHPGRVEGFFALFQPGGFQRLFGGHSSALADYAHPAADVIGPGIASVLDRIEAATRPKEMACALDGYLATRLSGAGELHPVDRAAQALAAAHGGIEAWTLAARAGLGDRHFRRRFVEHAGMGPKHYAKVARFTFALALKTAQPSRTWADVSQSAGYFDQMHLVKDFKSLTEAPPSRLISEIGPTGRDFFGPGTRDAESADLGLPHLGTAAMSVSY
ncbi:MAG TPA: helix-turn-helix domain-containing protein [Vicinamibacterales bacterium]|nr:helix-turn-helix domain-containing protein [Vicinamibacterales bacterium]